MTSKSQDPINQNNNPLQIIRQNVFIALYALVTIIVLILTIFLSIRALSPQPQAIPTVLSVISFTPTITPAVTGSATPTSTSRATFTPRPSFTPSITPTPSSTPTGTLPPSLTPSFPRTQGGTYNLVEWTPELADRLVELMQAYPRTLSAFARGEDNAGFYEAFKFAVFAQREALLQFPSAPQADRWSWDLAFNLARTGDSGAGDAYAILIANELNQERADLRSLPDIINHIDPRIEAQVTDLDQLPGYLSNTIVKVFSRGNGGTVIWLLETPNGFISHALTSEYDFIHPTSLDFFIGDLTRDATPEIVVYRSTMPGDRVYKIPRIFSIGVQPPEEIFFEPFQPPKVGSDFQVKWTSVEDIRSEADLKFMDTIFPACPVEVQHFFRWNGQFFEFLNANYQVEPEQDLLSFCENVINHAIQVWGPGPTIQIMETILPLWPPERSVDGRLYPADALDEWRFRLGVYHALQGNPARAREYLQGIVVNPATPESGWITPASEFLSTYQDQRDIYTACLLTDVCDPREATRAIIETFSGDDYSNAIQILSEANLQIRSSGFFDFDDDGVTERWLILRATTVSKPEFWILVKTKEGVKALNIGQIDETQPRIAFTEPPQEPPIVQLGNEITFTLQKGPAGPEIRFVEPIRIFSIDLTKEKLHAIEANLLGGADPDEMRRELLDLEASSFFTCSVDICPKFHYLLGLASELSRNESSAVEAYLTLWQEFPRSPFTTFARLKLEGIPPTPTPTSSPTATPTPTTTSTPTITPTPTRGEFITPTPSLTPGASPTSIEGYPPPGVSPTSTQASYPAPTP